MRRHQSGSAGSWDRPIGGVIFTAVSASSSVHNSCLSPYHISLPIYVVPIYVVPIHGARFVGVRTNPESAPGRPIGFGRLSRPQWGPWLPHRSSATTNHGSSQPGAIQRVLSKMVTHDPHEQPETSLLILEINGSNERVWLDRSFDPPCLKEPGHFPLYGF